MQCKNVEKYLLDYLANRLDDDQRAMIEDHLESCFKCRQKLIEERRVSKFLGTAKRSEEDDIFHQNIMERLEKEIKKEKEKKPITFSNLPICTRWIIIAGFLGFFIMIGIFVFKIQTPTEKYLTTYGKAGYTWVFKEGFEMPEDQKPPIMDSNQFDGSGWGGSYAALAGIDLEEDDDDKIVHQFDLNINGNIEENIENKKQIKSGVKRENEVSLE